MHKQTTTLFVFSILFFVSVLLVIFHTQLSSVTGIISFVTQPVQRMTFQIFAQRTTAQDQKQTAQIITQQSTSAQWNALKQENAALKDQFASATVPSQQLLPANIIGMPRFIPGISQPEEIIIDQGTKAGVEKNMPILVKDVLLGKVTTVTSTSAVVTLITNAEISFTATTQTTNALGIVRGLGRGKNDMENVELSDTLKVGDSVVTKGNQDAQGSGFPPNLVIGKISAVNRTPSALFQTASIRVPVDITRLNMVFVLLK